jgi:hypothetical protein
VLQFRSTIKKEENFMVKSLLIGLAAVLVLATGATAASSEQSKNPLRPGNVHRLCVWVEQGGTPDTAWDLKAVKAYTATHKVCIEGKKGKPGKNGKNGKAGAKGAAGAQGLQGTAGAQGLQGTAGEPGAKGDQGPQGPAGNDGQNGQNGTDGTNGVSVTSAVEPPGANCAEGGSEFTAANGVTYACNGADGEDGQDGENGFSGLIQVSGGHKTGEKQFTVDCPENEATPEEGDLLEAVSGGFNIQGSATADYRSDSAGNASDPVNDNTSWTIWQTSNALGSGIVYVYCMAPAAP